MRSRPDHKPDEVRDLVEMVMRAGLMLSDLFCNLVAEMPEDAYPGERPADVLLDMFTGTIRPVAEAAGAPSVAHLTALLGAMCDNTLADLRLAIEISRQSSDRG
jgi:hypothetical protein